MKEETLLKYKRLIDDMYKNEPYLMIKYTSTQIAEKLKISTAYARSILSKLQINFKKDVLKLMTDFPPYSFTYLEVISKTKIKSQINYYKQKEIL